jgi:hypothetical protein
MQTLFRRENICTRSAQIQFQSCAPLRPTCGAAECSQQKSIVQRERILLAALKGRLRGSIPSGNRLRAAELVKPNYSGVVCPTRLNYSGFFARLGCTLGGSPGIFG